MPAIVMAPICRGFDYRWSNLISYGYVRDDLLGVISNEQCIMGESEYQVRAL